MGSRPLVSCIIPTYNRPNHLRRAIGSILEQTYRPLELIIVDDFSSEDYISGVVQKINDESITPMIIRHNENNGASAARNSGIQSANGNYIAFLDDDDKWLPQKIEKQISDLEQSDATFSYCWVRRVGPNGEHRATHTPRTERNPTKRLFTGNFTGTTSTIVVTNDLCQRVGGFDQSLPRWNDWDFALRASQYTDFSLTSEILVHQFNWNGNQLSDDLEKLQTAQSRFINKHQCLAKEYDMERRFISRMYFGLGYSAGMTGQYTIARHSLLRAIRTYPFELEFYIYLFVFSGGKYTLLPAQMIRRLISRKIFEFP